MNGDVIALLNGLPSQLGSLIGGDPGIVNHGQTAEILLEVLDCLPGKTAIDVVHFAGVVPGAVSLLQEGQQALSVFHSHGVLLMWCPGRNRGLVN